MVGATPFSKSKDLISGLRQGSTDHPANREQLREAEVGDVRALYLQDRILGLEDELWHARRSNVTDFIGLIGRIREMSNEIFPGPVSMDYASDPEDPTNEYIVFDVVAKGNFADYKNLIYQWHDEVEKLCPGRLSEFRLIVHPKP